MVWLLVVTLCVGVLGNGLAWAYPWKVRRAIGVGPEDRARLAALPLEQRSPALLDLAPPGSWEGELAAELCVTSAEAEQVGIFNLSLDAVQHQLELATRWPRTGVWLTASGHLMALVAGFAAGARGELLIVLAVGVLAVAGCLTAGRCGRRLADRRRRDADGIVETLAGSLLRRHVAMPVRRRHRRKRS